MSKSRRRRLRKSKQNEDNSKGQPTINNIYVDSISRFTFDYVKNLLLTAYIRDIAQNFDGGIPDEISLICSNFFGRIKPNQLDSIIPKIMKYVMELDKSVIQPFCIYKCCRDETRVPSLTDYASEKTRRFRFNSHFHKLQPYMRKLFCRRILLEKKYAIYSIKMFAASNDEISLKEQFGYLEYVLLKRYKTVHKVDLSQINLTDNHIVYLCHIIENIIKYQTQRAQKKMKDNLQVNITMNLHELNLSLNPQISDKNIALLLRTIKKHSPKMKDLFLSSTKVTNKSISIIMKYNIENMKVHLTDCKGVTLETLNKEIRGDYEDDVTEKYVYCHKLIYFANQQESRLKSRNDRQRYIGKNKAKKWKRRG